MKLKSVLKRTTIKEIQVIKEWDKNLKMDLYENKFSTSEKTLRSIDEQIEQATDPILRQVEELYALLEGQIEFKSAWNREVTGSRRNETSASSTCNRLDTDQQNFCWMKFLLKKIEVRKSLLSWVWLKVLRFGINLVKSASCSSQVSPNFGVNLFLCECGYFSFRPRLISNWPLLNLVFGSIIIGHLPVSGSTVIFPISQCSAWWAEQTIMQIINTWLLWIRELLMNIVI